MDVPFAPLAHADVLQLVLQIAVLLGVARAFGEKAQYVELLGAQVDGLPIEASFTRRDIDGEIADHERPLPPLTPGAAQDGSHPRF